MHRIVSEHPDFAALETRRRDATERAAREREENAAATAAWETVALRAAQRGENIPPAPPAADDVLARSRMARQAFQQQEVQVFEQHADLFIEQLRDREMVLLDEAASLIDRLDRVAAELTDAGATLDVVARTAQIDVGGWFQQTVELGQVVDAVRHGRRFLVTDATVAVPGPVDSFRLAEVS